MISRYGKPQTTIIATLGLAAIGGAIAVGATWSPAVGYSAAGVLGVATACLLAFFRDPPRRVPTKRGHVIATADGVISSIHDIDHHPAFDGPAKCIRTFMSVLNVHVNRSPMHGEVISVEHKPGQFISALKAEAADVNEAVTMVMRHPNTGKPLCVVRQVAGAVARRIVNGADIGQILQRGERFGLIKFGSTTEVFLPNPEEVEVQVKEGQKVRGGLTTIAILPASRQVGTVTRVENDESVTSESDATTSAEPQEAPSTA